ncbi:MAG TPA: bifunctional UDP-N-acetylglucosamine diphosphorylase/glucosamine-1-phosphate N-acetyltransferase GlmU [Solirubrobacteraceae bacterium]|nr:bifunctional UDP-N-acetylglucosamine diphosphorylase/glucosamine-1-phosphate N-acetyltransferase GlmU [Solirubrobacteraceae bacterium]
MSAPTVLILAAGQGTRMRSATPKVLHDLCGIPMVLWPVRAALAAGAGAVVVVDSPAQPLAEVLPEGVLDVIQPTSNGTGGAVIAGLAGLDAAAGGSGQDEYASGGPGDRGAGGVEVTGGDAGAIGHDPDAPILVLSGDVPLVSAETISMLVQAHVDSDADATMASTLLDDPTGYGRVVRDPSGALLSVVETKAAGDATPEQLQIKEVNTGIYVFSAPALRAALPRLRSDNAQSELYLPQVLDLIRADGGSVAAHLVEDQRLVLGVNDRAALAAVRRLAQDAIHAKHLAAGATIVDPAATVIDVDVQIGPDTTIEPFTTLLGHTRIGSNCLIRHSYVVDSLLEDDVTVGPFAYLRPGTVLRAGSKAGTFVEIKNSDVGPRSKVPHLSYIGDADIGADTNLGASTITANYDGRAKHRTTIGSGVHSSVHVSFVAPVTVGDDAYTGAGSVIVQDIPPGALGIARERQTNKAGYADRKRPPAKEPGR